MSNYTIAIRTLGKAGSKYQKLLDSIKNLSHQPEKIVVVLPKGYSVPKEQLGTEEYVYSEKSMIGQRIEALKYIDTEYTLFLDDDISFEPNFVDKLLKPLEEGKFDCSTGPLFSFFPASFAGKIAGTLTASVSVSFFRRDMYVKILRSGGWSYHTFNTDEERYYPTESFAWTCFTIRTEVMRNLHMEDEQRWIERYGYAAGDDRVMAYKLVKMNYRACIVSNALYDHNDAKTSTSSDEMKQALPVFCMGYMQEVFWHRFIQDCESRRIYRGMNSFCHNYWQFMMHVYYFLKCVNASNRPLRDAFFSGIKGGKQYVRSREYKELPDWR